MRHLEPDWHLEPVSDCNEGTWFNHKKMRSASIVAFLGVAHAAYDKCDRPVAQWAGVNQARRP
jgi:hypothetical protein